MDGKAIDIGLPPSRKRFLGRIFHGLFMGSISAANYPMGVG